MLCSGTAMLEWKIGGMFAVLVSIAGWCSLSGRVSRMFRRSSDPRSCRAGSSRRYNSDERQGLWERIDWSSCSLIRADSCAVTVECVSPEVVRGIEIPFGESSAIEQVGSRQSHSIEIFACCSFEHSMLDRLPTYKHSAIRAMALS